jgi:glycosyltransferase involved in cell wall biosynthesis
VGPGSLSSATRRIAFAHDYMTQIGGAERVAGLFAERNPDWDLFTSLHREDAVPLNYIGSRSWTTSFLQRLPDRVPLKTMLPLLPHAFASFDLNEYETVISSSSAFAHHARKAQGASHISYCCTPPRFLWHSEEYFRGKPALRRLLAPLLASMRRQDLRAASGVDTYIAVSHHISERIRQTYGKEALVVNPPVDCERFQPTRERSGRFLVLSRLVPTKRVELVVEAASRYELPLDVIGLGPELPLLRRIAGPTVRFHGWQSDEDVRRAVAGCAAVVVAAEEDFGLVMAEAQAAGRPPVALARGGACEIIEDRLTGFLFHEQTAEAIATAMVRSQGKELHAADLRASAERFDKSRFWRDFDDVLTQAAGWSGRLSESGAVRA